MSDAVGVDVGVGVDVDVDVMLDVTLDEDAVLGSALGATRTCTCAVSGAFFVKSSVARRVDGLLQQLFPIASYV